MIGSDLAEFLDSLVADPALFPVYTEKGELLRTFCNLAVRAKMPEEEFHAFDGHDLLADGIYTIMASAPQPPLPSWRKVTGAEAQAWAAEGGRAIAAMPSWKLKEKHGHVVWVRPDPMVMSESLGALVPMCANIGKGDPGSPLVDGPPEECDEVLIPRKTRPNWTCKISQAFPPKLGEPHYFVYPV